MAKDEIGIMLIDIGPLTAEGFYAKGAFRRSLVVVEAPKRSVPGPTPIAVGKVEGTNTSAANA